MIRGFAAAQRAWDAAEPPEYYGDTDDCDGSERVACSDCGGCGSYRRGYAIATRCETCRGRCWVRCPGCPACVGECMPPSAVGMEE